MKELIAAKVYAESILDIAKEKELPIVEELTKFTEIINSSSDLENVIFLDVFTHAEKISVLEEVFQKTGFSSLSLNIVKFLITEKRANILPLIIKELIVIDDHRKGFLRGAIFGTDEEIKPSDKKKFQEYLKSKLGVEPSLEYIKTNEITAGYKVIVDDLQLDVSLDNQLNRFKESVFQ